MIRNSLPIFLLFLSFTAVAQHSVLPEMNNGNDIYGDYEKSQVENLYELYLHKIDPSYELINGREYFQYYFRCQFKPILFIDREHLSSITLKGKKYDDIYLDYDTYTDEVIYIDSTRFGIYSPLRVALNKENVDCFELCFGNDTMTFRYFTKDKDPLFDLQNGFYEVVLEGDSKYLIKHKSILREMTGIDEYIYTRVGYVNIGNGFSKITTARQLVKIFGNRSEEVKKFIKKSGIKIRKADKSQIMCVLRYYNNIKANIN